MTTPIDPLNPWAGDEPPVPVDPPEPAPDGPPVAPLPELPPPPGPRQTWGGAAVEMPLPEEGTATPRPRESAPGSSTGP